MNIVNPIYNIDVQTVADTTSSIINGEVIKPAGTKQIAIPCTKVPLFCYTVRDKLDNTAGSTLQIYKRDFETGEEDCFKYNFNTSSHDANRISDAHWDGSTITMTASSDTDQQETFRYIIAVSDVKVMLPTYTNTNKAMHGTITRVGSPDIEIPLANNPKFLLCSNYDLHTESQVSDSSTQYRANKMSYYIRDYNGETFIMQLAQNATPMTKTIASDNGTYGYQTSTGILKMKLVRSSTAAQYQTIYWEAFY